MSQHTRYLIALTVEAVIVAGIIAAIIGILVTWRREHAQDRAFWAMRPRLADILPDPTPATPVEHVGATEAYGAELRAAGQALPSADLRTTGEQMVADHHELAGISDGLDQFSERVMHELRLFLRDDAEYARVARWAPSSVVDTGTFPVIRAELAGAGAR